MTEIRQEKQIVIAVSDAQAAIDTVSDHDTAASLTKMKKGSPIAVSQLPHQLSIILSRNLPSQDTCCQLEEFSRLLTCSKCAPGENKSKRSRLNTADIFASTETGDLQIPQTSFIAFGLCMFDFFIGV